MSFIFLNGALRCGARRASLIAPSIRSATNSATASRRIRPHFGVTSILDYHPRWRRPSVIIGPVSSGCEHRFFKSATSTASVPLRSSSHPSSDAAPPPLSPPIVSKWLLFSASLVFGIVVVGGVTRLTESGLSIVEWRPITGTVPPLSHVDWEGEFEKYKLTPEFIMMNRAITLAEFKKIFFWEFTHRLLGRVIGLAFVIPLAYFALRRGSKRILTPGFQSIPLYSLLAFLIGAQGALGWYMVQSGLEEELLEKPGAVARVSQYRLASHLALALLLYVGMLSSGLKTRMDWKWAHYGVWSGLRVDTARGEAPWKGLLRKGAAVRNFRGASIGLAALVFVTAFSGAFVAGLDAGLIYNEFPMMGNGISPPASELMNPAYAVKPDGSDMWWRNIFENPTTVQFDHRLLGTTTYCATTVLYLKSIVSPALRAMLPPLSKRLILAALGIVNFQVALGITTLLYLVPIPVAAAHQAGSVALLTAMVGLVGSLRAPGSVSHIWRGISRAKQVARTTSVGS